MDITIVDGWWTFGDYDITLLVEAPGNIDTLAAVLSAASSGALTGLKTTVLVTMDEAIQALTAAQAIGYRPPDQS
ncbi:hypothetical protein BH23CHL2_BH23CHL2_19010 [soil metagenome]